MSFFDDGRIAPAISKTCPFKRRAARFAGQEDGALVVMTLFLIVCMLLAVGVGIDTMRYEVQRTKIQNTADRAVLAAASLNQDGDPEEVVNDYFARAGLDPSLVNVQITPTIGGKTVSASTDVSVRSLFLKLVGKPQLTGLAGSTASETVTDLEVALVLDNSGSMNSNNRLNLLKSAAKQFVDDVVRDDTGQGTVAISIVPFATQVNAGPVLTSHYNVSGEHAYSNCVTFEDEAFDQAALESTTPLRRTAHIDVFYYSNVILNNRVVCPWDASREITTWSKDKTALKDKIDAMWAGGNTSIDVGTRWGLALLDPSSRGLLTDLINTGAADYGLSGMPFDYTRPNTKKYLVVMSDGQNTTQYDVNAAFRSGPSPVWFHDTGSPNPKAGVSYYHEGNGQYYHVATNQWQAAPDGGAAAVNLTWPELFAKMSVAEYARWVKRQAIGGQWQTYYNEIVEYIPSGTKNTRTSDICAQARNAGITVFSIGMDTYGQGDATLSDCASGTSYFFDVAAQDIDDAFAAIARQINQLRLTQ